jgi:hypothetical protein
VQIVWSSRQGSRRIEHIGSAHGEDEVAALRVVAQQRLAAGQDELDLGLDSGAASGPLPIVGSKAGHLWDALCRAYDSLGFDRVTGGDEVFRALVLARIIEATSKLDSLRVLEETGVSASYRTVTRRLSRYGKPLWRKEISAACGAHAALGPASLVLYDVSTLYFETDQGDGFREPGFSKERRLEPQITIGLLTDATGFPLAVEAFEGNYSMTWGRDRHHAAHAAGVHDRAPTVRRHRRRRRRDALGRKQESDRDRRARVHPRQPNRPYPLRHQ